MRVSRNVLASVVLAIATTAVGGAKGPTVKLSISGDYLPQPIDVTTPAALVHVWGDDFIGPSAERPPVGLMRYQVAFHVVPNGTRDPRVMYVITYVHDPITDQGFVYLPGRGETHHTLNVSTILRGKEGRWHHARDAWARAINAALKR